MDGECIDKFDVCNWYVYLDGVDYGGYCIVYVWEGVYGCGYGFGLWIQFQCDFGDDVKCFFVVDEEVCQVVVC